MGLFDLFKRPDDSSMDASIPSAPLAPEAPTQEVQRQRVGSYGWQMQQLMESEQRSDAAIRRALNSQRRLIRGEAKDATGRKLDTSKNFSHVRRDGTVETFNPDIHGIAEQTEIEDPLYGRSAKRQQERHIPNLPRKSAEQIEADRERSGCELLKLSEIEGMTQNEVTEFARLRIFSLHGRQDKLTMSFCSGPDGSAYIEVHWRID